MLEYTNRIGGTPTFLYFDLWLLRFTCKISYRYESRTVTRSCRSSTATGMNSYRYDVNTPLKDISCFSRGNWTKSCKHPLKDISYFSRGNWTKSWCKSPLKDISCFSRENQRKVDVNQDKLISYTDLQLISFKFSLWISNKFDKKYLINDLRTCWIFSLTFSWWFLPLSWKSTL